MYIQPQRMAEPVLSAAGRQAVKDYVWKLDRAESVKDLTALLGLKVSINFQGSGGSLTIHYKTLEQLDDVLHRLNQMPPPTL